MITFLINVLFFILPLQIFLNFNKTFSISLDRLLIIVLFFIIFAALISKKINFLIILRKPPVAVLFLFLVIIFLSLVIAEQKGWAIRKIIFLSNIAAMVPIIFYYIDKNEKIQLIFKYLRYSCIAVIFISLAQFIFQFIFSKSAIFGFLAKIGPYLWGINLAKAVLNVPSWYVKVGNIDILRAFLPFPDPHSLAIFLNLIYPLILIALFKALISKKSAYLLIAGIIVIQLLTFSRAGYLVFLIENIGILMFFKNSRRLIGSVLGSLTALLLIAPFISGRFLNIFNLNDFSSLGRLKMWQKSLELFLVNPITGIGLGNFPYYMNRFIGYWSPINVHNVYLEILVEAGIFALLAWLAFIVLICIKAYKDNLWFYGIAILGFAVHSFFETAIYNTPNLILFFTISALILISDKDYNVWLKT